MTTDKSYKLLLKNILTYGDVLLTRNSETYSDIALESVRFTSFPLVTVRRTAWKLALAEMEWFMSGIPECPEKLKHWWKGQLANGETYIDGYSSQFRDSSYCGIDMKLAGFDQVKFILEALRNNPSSRRIILTSWNPGEMANITETNRNPNTPTTCHNTCTQFFVREGKLHVKTYQRSADMLLGVPHNWVQTWAMLLYFAYHSGLVPGTLQWTFGDAHIYKEESHLQAVYEILAISDEFLEKDILIDLVYSPSDIEYDWNNVPVFKAEDFKLVGEVPEPLVKTKPKLI